MATYGSIAIRDLLLTYKHVKVKRYKIKSNPQLIFLSGKNCKYRYTRIVQKSEKTEIRTT